MTFMCKAVLLERLKRVRKSTTKAAAAYRFLFLIKKTSGCVKYQSHLLYSFYLIMILLYDQNLTLILACAITLTVKAQTTPNNSSFRQN
jgi:hypothetical protein